MAESGAKQSTQPQEKSQGNGDQDFAKASKLIAIVW